MHTCFAAIFDISDSGGYIAVTVEASPGPPFKEGPPKPNDPSSSSHPLPWAPLPIFLAGARIPSRVTARLSLHQEGRTRVEALVEGELELPLLCLCLY